MIVAMRIVAAMEMSGNEVVRMVAVGNGFVSAIGAMRVTGGVALARVRARARGGIGCGHLQPMLVDVSVVDVMEVAVVEVVDVVAMLDAGMRAIRRAVRVSVIGMCRVFHATSEPYRGRFRKRELARLSATVRRGVLR